MAFAPILADGIPNDSVVMDFVEMKDLGLLIGKWPYLAISRGAKVTLLTPMGHNSNIEPYWPS